MNKIIYISILVIILAILVFAAHLYNSPKNKWEEGNSVDTGNYLVVLESSNEENHNYIRIQVFNKNKYQNISLANRSFQQENNPTAEYLLPIKIWARCSTIEYNKSTNTVTIIQGTVNKEKQHIIKVNLNDYSISHIVDSNP